ncbi:MAG: carbamoyltransferase C-terminal domain-containing protein, partial [Candidatus Omnitrophica bacterium]|nr:carbamoyltransferase C-terminal domain-containing protein [Candidatus Omnitrophota bacterium]
MNILGVGTPFIHDPSAVILVDGKLIAACDEERLIRKKHAMGYLPIKAIQFCLKAANLRPSDVDVVAFPWSHDIYREKKGEYFRRCLKPRTSHAMKVFTREKSRLRGKEQKLSTILEKTGIDPKKVKKYFVEHHLAHASSAYHLSGMKDCAIMSIDGAGEFTSTLFAKSENGKIKKIKEIIWPDSLGLFYSTITEYLGFEVNDGEYKVMGMAPFGDPSKFDMSHIIRYANKSFYCNDDYVWVTRSRRYDKNKVFSKKMVAEWGPPRSGDGLSEPYIHIAAATQQALEEITIRLMEDYLGDTLKANGGRLCFAGGVALNVKLNKRLLEHPLVKELFVQPASNDSGTALGAATYAAHSLGEKIEPMKHAYLGPEYTDDEIKTMLDTYKIPYEYKMDIVETAADLLAKGEIVAWFQGRMEYGPRALGNRSILSNPSVKGISDKINSIIKFREKWRPFCPAILKEYAKEILDTDHPSPYMTFSFTVNEKWRDKIKEVVHVDNTARPQIVDEESNPKFYKLLKSFHKKTGLPVLINTSLNRRGEPMICSPEDA